MSHSAMKSPKRKTGRDHSRLDAKALYKGVLTIFLKDLPEEWTDTKLKLLSAVRREEWKEVYALADEMARTTWPTSQDQYLASQLSALILKYPDSDLFEFELSPRENAEKKFKESEERCRRTNVRFRRSLSSGAFYKSRFFPLLEGMRLWIHRVLGPLDLTEVYTSCSFGSGSAIGVAGNATHFGRKFDGVWTASEAVVPLAARAIHCNTQWRLGLLSGGSTEGVVCLDDDDFTTKFRGKLEIVGHNKIDFVPKNAKTERTIAIEPSLNNLIQNGIDKVMRRALKRAGYDLTDQERNQHLARRGSVDGSLATIDLSSASDSISIELVRYLMPPDWLWLLSHSRSPTYTLNGSLSKYHKFTSMGNGFCFPLETLIFAAAVKSCKRAHHSLVSDAVYGDDIIVDSSVAPLLIALLSYIGFRTNDDKTFVSGPFRESCGADWYRGRDVRPVYLDFLLSDATAVRIFHNATLRSENTRISFAGVREYLRSAVRPKDLLLRPDFGWVSVAARGIYQRLEQSNLDGAFTVPLDVFMASRCARWDRKEQRWRWYEVRNVLVVDEPGLPYSRYLLFLSGIKEGLGALRFTTKSRQMLV